MKLFIRLLLLSFASAAAAHAASIELTFSDSLVPTFQKTLTLQIRADGKASGVSSVTTHPNFTVDPSAPKDSKGTTAVINQPLQFGTIVTVRPAIGNAAIVHVLHRTLLKPSDLAAVPPAYSEYSQTMPIAPNGTETITIPNIGSITAHYLP